MILVIGCDRRDYEEFLYGQCTPSIYYYWRDGLVGRGFDGILDLNIKHHPVDERRSFYTRLYNIHIVSKEVLKKEMLNG